MSPRAACSGIANTRKHTHTRLQEEILEREAELPSRLREKAGLGRRETVEKQTWGGHRVFPGRVIVRGREEAWTTAREWKGDSRTAWTDGSRLDNGKVGAAVVWREGKGSKG